MIHGEVNVVVNVYLATMDCILPIRLTNVSDRFRIPIFFLLLLRLRIAICNFLSVRTLLLNGDDLMTRHKCIRCRKNMQAKRVMVDCETVRTSVRLGGFDQSSSR